MAYFAQTVQKGSKEQQQRLGMAREKHQNSKVLCFSFEREEVKWVLL
jgi:hypothetical protein